MGRNIPILNRDLDWCREWLEKNTSSPMVQKKLVLVVVSIALLLDNMLYMVIVPIIPRYLREIRAYDVEYVGYQNVTTRLPNGTVLIKMTGGAIDYLDEEVELGWLFASKALLQIFVNPFSGFVIDRIGYELPMIIGLVVMFSSTAIFALGRSYGVLFFARSLQGFGSAFADTSGLAMIADRFTEENERSAALGIALAFISFGCLVAPPFGSVLYTLAGKPVPFLILSLICLIDAFMVFMVIEQKQRPTVRASRSADPSEKVNGTPMWKLFMDPFVAICSGALIMANVSLAFLEPTITNWMNEVMPDTPKWMLGMIWFPAFFPHVLGVYVTVQLLKRYPQSPWLLALIGLAMEGLSCIFLPFMNSIVLLIIPLSTICFGIALVDTSLLPLLGYLVDTRHVSVYGSVYAIADISYSLAYAFGPIIAGNVVHSMGFTALNIIICVVNVAYLPLLYMLRKVYAYEELNGQSNALNNNAANNNGVAQPLTASDSAKFNDSNASSNPFGGGGYQTDSYQNNTNVPTAGGGVPAFDPLNPQW